MPAAFDLSGRVAVVTGAGSPDGIGFACAGLLAELGAAVMIGGTTDRIETRAGELRAAGFDAAGFTGDLTSEETASGLVSATLERWGRLDVVVNNAGTSWGAPAVEHPLEAWRKVIDVNLTGTFLVSQAAGRVMIERGGGKIVNIASNAAFGGLPPELMDAVAYSASKGGVVSLTRDLAVKWARHGITVNALAPGWFPTEMSRVLVEQRGEGLLAEIPLGRFGGPHDLKGAIGFLGSAASDFVTGQVLIVDGGQTAR
jgi:gluconate 5-dehydrogenase